VALEQIAELEILAEHVEAFVAAETLELGGLLATIHARGERAACQAVAAEIAEPGRRRGSFDDRGPRPRA